MNEASASAFTMKAVLTANMMSTTNSKSIVFFSAQNEIFVYVGIIHAENLFDI